MPKDRIVYESFFGLREPAFSLTPDPRFLWLSDTHHEGLATLYYGITCRKGFLLLTGEVGAGKTTLLRAVLDKIPQDTEIALVLNTTSLSAMDLLKFIASEFRIPGNLPSKSDYVIAINKLLLERLEKNLNTVLIIDEGQNLSRAALEEVRLLSNLETNSEKLLQIVLTGQPELREKLADPSLRQLRQRIAITHHVDALRVDEVKLFLKHRIAVAGGVYEKIFQPGVEQALHEYSGGCPRILNLIADAALLAAFSKNIKVLTPQFVAKKAQTMNDALALTPFQKLLQWRERWAK